VAKHNLARLPWQPTTLFSPSQAVLQLQRHLASRNNSALPNRYFNRKQPNMSWRNQGITGSNNIPLGKARRFPGSDAGDEERSALSSPSAFSNGGGGERDQRERNHERERDRDVKRGRSPESTLPFTYSVSTTNRAIGAEEDGPKRRKKRNRWGDATENKAAGLMGLPTAIVANMTSEQLEAYTLHLRIEEITQKLKIDDVVPADGDRYELRYSFSSYNTNKCFAGRHRPLLNTTTMVAVSILENTAIASALKRSATS